MLNININMKEAWDIWSIVNNKIRKNKIEPKLWPCLFKRRTFYLKMTINIQPLKVLKFMCQKNLYEYTIIQLSSERFRIQVRFRQFNSHQIMHTIIDLVLNMHTVYITNHRYIQNWSTFCFTYYMHARIYLVMICCFSD